MTDEELGIKMQSEKIFRGTDIKTGYPLSEEECKRYLSIINSCPFIVENNYKIVQMFVYKSSDLVRFNGMVAWNDPKRYGGFCIDGVIDFKNRIIDIGFAEGKKDFGGYRTIRFEELISGDGKVIK